MSEQTTERIAAALERIAESLSKLEAGLDTTNAKLTDIREGVGIVSCVIEDMAGCMPSEISTVRKSNR
jgi:hypothetical protein